MQKAMIFLTFFPRKKLRVCEHNDENLEHINTL